MRQKEEVIDVGSDCEEGATKIQKTIPNPLAIEKAESEAFNSLYEKA